MRTSKIVMIIILVLSTATGWYFFTQHNPTTTETKPVHKAASERAQTVSITQIKRQDIPIQISTLGTVTPIQQVVLHSRVDGELMSLQFKEGDWVKKGQLLAEIDPRPLQAELAQHQAQAQHDQALLNNAKTDLKRYQQLSQDEAVSSQQIDTQRALVKQYEANLAGTQALIETTKLQLSYCQIRSPISGKAGFRKLDVGNYVHSNDTEGLVHIAQIDPIAIVFSLPEQQGAELYRVMQDQQQTWTISAWQRDGETAIGDGKIISADNQIDLNTGTLKFKAHFNNAQQHLIPNQFVRLNLTSKTLNQIMTLPKAAILMREEGEFIYQVQADDRVLLTPIKSLYSQNNVTAFRWINETEDETLPVVLEGTDKLKAGARVKYRQQGNAEMQTKKSPKEDSEDSSRQVR